MRPDHEVTASGSRSSLMALIAANALPALGVVFFGWSATSILALYWFENVVIGGFTALRMALCPPPHAVKLFYVPFFCAHFGMFTLVHGVFLVFLLGAGHADLEAVPREVGSIASQSLSPTGLLVAVSGLAVSHGVSFVTNFIGARERENLTLPQVMLAPYPRIVVMHVTILVGGVLTTVLGLPSVMTLLLIALKTWLDAKAHLREHAKFGGVG